MAYKLVVTTVGATPTLVAARHGGDLTSVIEDLHTLLLPGVLRRGVVTGPDGSGAIVVHHYDGWVVTPILSAANRTALELRARLNSTRSAT